MAASSSLSLAAASTSSGGSGSSGTSGGEAPARWIDGFADYVATDVATNSSCMVLANAIGDGDNRLIIANRGTRDSAGVPNIIGYQGLKRIGARVPMLVEPVACCAFYMNAKSAAGSACEVAVAGGDTIYVYRLLKPYVKFRLPIIEAAAAEKTIWNRLQSREIDATAAIKALDEAQNAAVQLTPTSIALLALGTEVERLRYVESHMNESIDRPATITCMTVMKKSVEEETDSSLLVVGTENKTLYVISASKNTAKGFLSIIATIPLLSSAVAVQVTGQYTVNHRIVVAGRDSKIYSIKKGEVQLGNSIIELDSPAIGIVVPDEKSVVVATMSNRLCSYSLKGGKTLFTVNLPCAATEIAPFHRKSKDYKAVVVGLRNRTIRIYKEASLVSIIPVEGIVTGMVFGQFAREDDNLVITLKGGAVVVKVLPWSQNLETKVASGALDEGAIAAVKEVPLNIPKKTRVYVDHASRERQVAAEMHRVFQRDLHKLRLLTARSFVKTLEGSLAPSSTTVSASLKLNVQVLGLGPAFQLKLVFHNTGQSYVSDLPVVFDYNRLMYSMTAPLLRLPLLVPGVEYVFYVALECFSPTGASAPVRVLVGKPNSSLPLITCIVNMPTSLQESLE